MQLVGNKFWFAVAAAAVLCEAAAETDPLTERLRALSGRELFALARKHGVDDEIFPRRKGVVVEKSEVVALLREVVAQDEARERRKRRAWWLKVGGTAVAACVAVAVAWRPLWHSSFRYQFRQTYDLMFHAVNAGSPAAAWGVMACAWIEFMSAFLRYSVLLSWVVPRDSAFRKLLLTTYVPSLPVSLGGVSGFPAFGLDVAPLVLLWLGSWLHRRLARWVGHRMQLTHSHRASSSSGSGAQQRQQQQGYSSSSSSVGGGGHHQGSRRRRVVY